MILHYLSLAWQQLEKYRLQSLVSIVSLAIGFACFAFASMWIKYETTYDAFHKDAEGLYTLMENNGIGSCATSKHLEQIPEIVEYTTFSGWRWLKVKDTDVRTYNVSLYDDNFLSVFGMNILEGNDGFLHNPQEVAISDLLAKQLWGDESPIGKALNLENGTSEPWLQTRTVTAVFKDWGHHTNYPMNVIGVYPENTPTKNDWALCVLRLQPHANTDTVCKKLKELIIEDLYKGADLVGNLGIVPLMKMRHKEKFYNEDAKIKVDHIYLFSVASLLLIACGLLSYLTMFINRLFIRQREMALRTVFGATGRDLIMQFLVEYGLLLLIAIVLGVFAVELSLDWFYSLAQLPLSREYIYGEIAIYFSCVTIVSFLISLPFIVYFQRQSLQSSIIGGGGLMRYHLFRRISTGIQLGISIFCIFYMTVMMKQLDSLRHEDIGFKRENRGIIYINRSYFTALSAFLIQQPEIDTVVGNDNTPLFPAYDNSISYKITSEDNPLLDESFGAHSPNVTEAAIKYYEPTLLQGEWPRRRGEYLGINQEIAVNEIFVRHMGWKEAIGQRVIALRDGDPNAKGSYIVVGVFKDIRNLSPTTKAIPWIITYIDPEVRNIAGILLKYKPSTWPVVQQKVLELYKKNEWGKPYMESFDEVYDKMLKSEKNLQKLLSITTGVCILIALFGVWSMIMLTCEQRRKEIAVRKVFGATTKDILDMFIVEYMALQGVAALVAFPVGYACMKPWLEQYVVQTSIPWWIYVGIFMAVALLVALCVGWRVWKTAKARPADEIAKG
ncbi:MAG: FtsX-like permease family protein [Bacteroidaceae bacterium]|nr:FtsX-like permease family protein [Bacteroidaceae bacterium]